MSGSGDDGAAEDPHSPGAIRRTLRTLDRRLPETFLALAWLATVYGLLGYQPLGERAELPGFLPLWLGCATEVISATWKPGAALVLVLAGWSVFRRRYWIALAFLPVALIAAVPEWTAGSPKPLQGPALRVATVNLLANNHADPLMDAALLDLAPDIFVFPEFTPRWKERLQQTFADDYPHRVEAPQANPFGIAVWSRLPLVSLPDTRRFGGSRPQLRVEVDWLGRRIALFAIHPNKPFPMWSWPRAVNDRKELLKWVSTETLPAVIAGDFNATPRSPWMRSLEELGFTSVYEKSRTGLIPTWPANHPWTPWMGITIDHVLCSDEFVPGSYRIGPRTMSDHKGVVVELGWAPRN